MKSTNDIRKAATDFSRRRETDDGKKSQAHRREIAIVMAAGRGNRMLPLTESVPKPLVPVGGRPLIETVLAALERRGVAEIYVVVGYRKEMFQGLPRQHPRVRLLENPAFDTMNNLNSVAVAAAPMARADCFVCEADLFVASETLLCRPLERSGYFAKYVAGRSDDWVFGTAGGRITRIGRDGTDCFNMVGLSYFRQPDAAKIASRIAREAKDPANAQLFWDEIVDRMVGEGLELAIHEVGPGEIVECDSVADLRALERSLP